jgi:FKBP-type peptidyl-prolyl cis-trans isomerase FklB
MFLIIGMVASLARAAEDNAAFPDERAKASYSVGVNMGAQMKREKMDLDLDLILKGIKDTMAGHPQLTEQEVRDAWTSYNQKHRKDLAETNKLAGQTFLAENKNKEGIKTLEVTLPDGTKSELQYKILEEGKGDSPKSNDVVTVNYRGTLIDGTEVDSSIKRGQPLVRQANMLIKGWTEALQRMKPGAKWQLFIPSELGYGERGAGPQSPIGPNATLIFDMELVSFNPPAPPPPSPAPPNQPVTSDIIKVPSKAELEKGAKIEVIKKEDLEKLQKEQQQKQPEKK